MGQRTPKNPCVPTCKWSFSTAKARMYKRSPTRFQTSPSRPFQIGQRSSTSNRFLIHCELHTLLLVGFKHAVKPIFSSNVWKFSFVKTRHPAFLVFPPFFLTSGKEQMVIFSGDYFNFFSLFKNICFWSTLCIEYQILRIFQKMG